MGYRLSGQAYSPFMDKVRCSGDMCSKLESVLPVCEQDSAEWKYLWKSGSHYISSEDAPLRVLSSPGKMIMLAK